MPIYPPPHLHRRQGTAIPIPTGIGSVGGATTIATEAAPTVSLAVDTSVAVTQAVSAPSLAPFTSVMVTTSPSPTAEVSPQQSSSSSISMSTVIGVCVGTFFAVTLLILLGWWMYKRSVSNMRRKRARAPHNARRENERARAKAETWNKLEDVDVPLANGKPQTRELDHLPPMEKLTMFKNSISRPASEKDAASVAFDHHSISRYHPHLAEELADSRKRPFLGPGSIEQGSNDDEAAESLMARELSNGAMSPPMSRAIPTPQVISYGPHRWESAEVMHFDGESGVVERDGKKGKGRAVERNPFGDVYGSRLAVPGHHHANLSSSSTSSNERAIQSLIAALDVTPEEVQERLRVASMQGSIVSLEGVSAAAFPAPPG